MALTEHVPVFPDGAIDVHVSVAVELTCSST